MIFDLPNEKWKEFIYNNRVGKDFLISNYNNLKQKYAYVYSCVADLNITKITRQIKLSEINYGVFIDNLKPLKMGNYNQLSFHSDTSTKSLNFINIEIIEREVLMI